MLPFDLSYSEVLTTVVSFLIVTFLYTILIKPLFDIEFYRRQGLTPNYFPIMGEVAFYDDHAEKHKDSYYHIKQQINKDPNFKGSAMSIGGRCYVVLANVDLIRHFSQIQGEVSTKDPQLNYSIKLVNGKGYSHLDGDYHRYFRKVMSSAFHFDFLKGIIPIVQQNTSEVFEDWEKRGLKDINIALDLSSITGETVNEAFFGADIKSNKFNDSRLTDTIPALSAMASRINFSASFFLFGPILVKLNLLPDHRRFNKMIKEFKEHCLKFVKARKEVITRDRSKANDKYIIDNLLLLQQDEKSKYPISDLEILDNYILFFRGGQDTTAHLLTMCVYNLAKYPEYCKKIREEVAANIPDTKNFVYEDLGKLDFLTAFIKETFRLYGPAPQIRPRLLKKDCMIGDVKFKKGTIVNIYSFFAGCNKKYFKDPERFDPNRWMPGGEGCNLADPLMFLPFWAGTRNCIGQQVVWIESRIILSRIVERYNIKLKPGYELKMALKLLYEPLDPLIVDFERVI